MSYPLVDDVTEGLRAEVTRRLRSEDLPDAAYAAIGGLTRTRLGVDRLRHEVTALPNRARNLPNTTYNVAAGSVTSMTRLGIRTMGDIQVLVESTYAELVTTGEDAVVTAAAERAVRKRMARAEDQVTPRVAAAAVRLQARRRRRQQMANNRSQNPRVQRAREFASRSAQRFAEMNAPVLEDDPQD